MRIISIVIFALSFTVHGKADPDFIVDYPNKECLTDEIRSDINNQLADNKHIESVSKLEFYLKLRQKIISENAVSTQEVLDFELLFLIHSVLSNASKSEINVIKKIRDQLILSPLNNNDDLNQRAIVPINEFLNDAV